MIDDGEEAVDGEPVLDDAAMSLAAVAPSRSGLTTVVSPAVQAAAAVATGFVAGAATLALSRRRAPRGPARVSTRRRPVDALSIVGTRSFLIDVHMLRIEE